MKKVISLILSLCMFVFMTIPVYADDTSNVKEFKKELESMLGRTISDKEVSAWSGAIVTMRTDKMTEECIAGIMANMLHEGASGLFALEAHTGVKTKEGKTYAEFEEDKSYEYTTAVTSPYGTGGEGHGLIQWSFERADSLCKMSEKYPYVTVKHYRQKQNKFETCKIPNSEGQIAFMLTELHGGYSSVYNKVKDSKSAEDVAKIICTEYEIPAEASTQAYIRAADTTKVMNLLKKCDGVISSGDDATDSQNKKDLNQTADIMLSGNFWSEEQFVSLKKLADNPIKLPKLDDLSAPDKQNVKEWTNDVKDTQEYGVFGVLRTVVTFLGILITVYSVFLYIAYQFDTIQNIVDIQLLPVLTLGHLTISADKDKSTFSTNNKGKKTVTHKDMCIVCITGVAIGVMIISGFLFKLINNIVLFIKGLF